MDIVLSLALHFPQHCVDILKSYMGSQKSFEFKQEWVSYAYFQVICDQ